MKETRVLNDVGDRDIGNDMAGNKKREKKNGQFKQCKSQPDLVGYESEFAVAEEIPPPPTRQSRWSSDKKTRRKELQQTRSQQLLATTSPTNETTGYVDKALPRSRISRRSKSADSFGRSKSARNRSESIGDRLKSTELVDAMAENYKICFSLMELAQHVPTVDGLVNVDEADEDYPDGNEALVAKENVARHRSFHNKKAVLLDEELLAPSSGRRRSRKQDRNQNRQLVMADVLRQENGGLLQQQTTPMSDYMPRVSRNFDRSERIVDIATGSVYYRGKLLGKGGFAKCYELIDAYAPAQRFAGKIIPKPKLMKPHHKGKILREIDLHRHLSHPNIVAFFGDFEDDVNIYIVLELCTRKSMVSIMKTRKTLTDPEVRYFMAQLVEGCKYIHSRHIIHRDLKLGNLLLSEQMEVKITDFGLATEVFYVGEKKTSVCGTPNYISPEVLSKKGYSYEVDIWAIGCIMYAMLVGKPPFETPNLKETYARIVASRYYLPPNLSSSSRVLIKQSLAKEPFRRPTLDQILSSEFFTTGFFPKSLPTHCCYRAPQFPTSRQSSVPGDSANSGTPTQPALMGTADLVGRQSAVPVVGNAKTKELTNTAAAGQPLLIPYFPVQSPMQQMNHVQPNNHQRQDFRNAYENVVITAVPIAGRVPLKNTRKWKSMDAIERTDRADSRGRSKLGRFWQGIKRRFRSLSRKRKKNSCEAVDGKIPEQRKVSNDNMPLTSAKSRRTDGADLRSANAALLREQQRQNAARTASLSIDLDDNLPEKIFPVSRSTISLATPGIDNDADNVANVVRPPKVLNMRKQSAPAGPIPHSTPLSSRQIYGSNFSLSSAKTGATVSSGRNVSHMSANSANLSIVSNDFRDMINYNTEFSRQPSFTFTGELNNENEDSHSGDDLLDGYVSRSKFMAKLLPDQKNLKRSESYAIPIYNAHNGVKKSNKQVQKMTPIIQNGVNLDDSVTFPLRRAGSLQVTGSAMEMYHKLKKCLRNMRTDSNEPPIPMRDHSPICITKWVDYSVKYGFGFQLTDGCVGVLFQDTTRMLLSADQGGNGNRLVHYNDLSNKVFTFATDDTPNEYKSKCTLLFYFAQYMDDHLVPGGDIITRPTVTQDDAIFLKKWFRTSRAIVMYLSNGTLQINFMKNHKKIVINSTSSGYCATFISSKRQATSYLLDILAEYGCQQDMLEGLQYAGRVMENIVNFEGEAV